MERGRDGPAQALRDRGGGPPLRHTSSPEAAGPGDGQQRARVGAEAWVRESGPFSVRVWCLPLPGPRGQSRGEDLSHAGCGRPRGLHRARCSLFSGYQPSLPLGEGMRPGSGAGGPGPTPHRGHPEQDKGSTHLEMNVAREDKSGETEDIWP